MKRSAIRQLNYYEQPESFETFTGDSETIPEQSMTVKEVLQRFQAGTLPDVVKKPYYSGSDDFDNINILENPDFDMVDAENAILEAEKIKASILANQPAQKLNSMTPPIEEEPAMTIETKE